MAYLQPEANFSRFNIYAPWVKHFELWGGRKLSEEQLDLLYRYSATRILLPNLQSIAFTNGYGFAEVSWVIPFLSPSLVAVEFGHLDYGGTPKISLSAFTLFLGALSKKCPELRTLAIPTSTAPPFSESDTTQISGHTALSDLKLELKGWLKNGPVQALARIHPLVSLTISSDVLDHSSLNLIGTWSLLARLGVEGGGEVVSLFSALAESAFPSLGHLAFYSLDSKDALGIFQNAPRALMGRLNSIKLFSPRGWDIFHGGLPFGLRILSVLAKRSPHLQNIWLRICDPDFSVYNIPISVLDVLQGLPLRSLYIEGIYLTECDNVPDYLAAKFPGLKDIGLPNHRAALADLQTYCNSIPQLESLCLDLKAESLTSDLGVVLSNIERYRRSPFHTLDARFRGKDQYEDVKKFSSYKYHEVVLFVRYLFSLWPNLQLFDHKVPTLDSGLDTPMCMTRLINKQLAVFSYGNRDPTFNYEDASVLNEESWKQCLRDIAPRSTGNG